MTKGLVLSALAAAVVVIAACAVHQGDEAPPLTGPSELAQSVTITVTPDRITQDGQSRSQVTIKVLGPNAEPLSGIEIRLDMIVNGILADFGTLSQKNVVTGSDGRASSVYTAPPAPPPSLNSGSNTVTIRAIPVGNNAFLSVSTTADIRLVPPGIILPPADAPTAAFTVSPTPPLALNVSAIFDGSSSCPGAADNNGNCLATTSQSISSYAWNFGDGGSDSGRTVSHRFGAVGTFSVTLTVTNDRGIPASTTQPVTVGALGGLTAAFVFSPSQPHTIDTIQFNGSTSQAPVGHRIVSYAWNFGDGSVGTGVTPNHRFAAAGTYNVVLVVTDDTSQQATTSVGVAVLP